MNKAAHDALESALWNAGPGSDCPHCKMPAKLATVARPGLIGGGRLEPDGTTTLVASRVYLCYWCERPWKVRVELPETPTADSPAPPRPESPPA